MGSDVSGIEWVDAPPEPGRRPGRWQATSKELAQKPGQWAKVADAADATKAAAFAFQLRKLGCEAAARTTDDGASVYARWPKD